jgi:hypothetical protein
VDVRTPLWGKRPRSAIIDECRQALGSTDIPELNSLDLAEVEKVGPLSFMYPYKEREGDVDKYYHQSCSFDKESALNAISIVDNLLPPSSVRPLSIENGYEAIPHNKSWGLPWVTSDPGIGPWYLRAVSSITSPDQVLPSIIYWRGQQAGPGKTKQRVVWGACKLGTILEATLMYPLLEALRPQLGFSAWGTPDDVAVAVTKLIRMDMSLGVPLISGDYSGFDSSVPGEVLDLVWDVIEHWLVPEVSPRVRLVREAFKTVPLVVPWEVRRGRTGGVPSGSVFTNFVDSLVNLFAGYYAAVRNGVELVGFEVLGDDSIFVYNPPLSSDKLCDTVGELGLKMSTEKQFIHDEAVHYLQRLHKSSYMRNGVMVGVHSPYRSLSGLTGMEIYRDEADWNEYLVSARAIMQVENCRYHPKFAEFVRFYVGGDELVGQGMDPVEIFQ